MFTHTSDSKNLAKIRAELRAIKEVKEELAIEYAKDKDGPGFKYAQKRLLNLSLTIDVDAALKVLGDNEDVLVA